MNNQIDVTFCCWPNHPRRIEYFTRCLGTVLPRLSASRHEIVWHCSSESQRDPAARWMGDDLEALCKEHKIELLWRTKPADLGAAMNDAWRVGLAPRAFVIQDDFELLHPCDLSPGIELLDAELPIDLIRYGWPPMTEWRGTIRGFPVVKIDGMWPYGDEPQMRRRSFHDKWGWFTEYHPRHGQSETDLLYKLVRGRAIIVGADKMYFGNMGGVSAVPVKREYRDRAEKR